MDLYTKLLGFAVIGFSILIFIEWLASVILKQKVHRLIDSISSLLSGITNIVKDILKLGIVIVSYQWSFEYLALFDLPTNGWIYLLALIGIDFASYWGHRWNHEYNLLWNRHIVHHSSEEFNLPCALRQSISAIVQIYFFLYVPMAILGVKPEVIVIVAPLHLFAQFWYHTRLINKMGFLEHIIVTPSHHRVHHAINTEYIDKNYSAIFIVWDKWFGTFQPELDDVPPVYGVKRPVQTWNAIIINYMHLWQLIVDAWHTKSIKDKLRIWFMPTGWRPVDVNEKYPLLVDDDATKQKKYDTPSNLLLIVWVLIQFIATTLLLLHFATHMGTMSASQALVYGGFIFIQVFAITELMNVSRLSIIAEGVKVAVGMLILAYYGSWLAFDIANIIPISYLLISLLSAMLVKSSLTSSE